MYTYAHIFMYISIYRALSLSLPLPPSLPPSPPPSLPPSPNLVRRGRVTQDCLLLPGGVPRGSTPVDIARSPTGPVLSLLRTSPVLSHRKSS